jgi:hypothetical protein
MRATSFVLAAVTCIAFALTGCASAADDGDLSDDESAEDGTAGTTAEALSGAKCDWAEQRANKGMCEPSRHGSKTWLMCPIATDGKVFNDLKQHLGAKNVTRSSQKSGYQIVVSGC